MKNEYKHDTLGNRMKSYEALSTSRMLMANTPIYARIDGRAFHTFCRGLEKPFSMEFITVMQEVTKALVKDFNPILGYVESDEISLGWMDSTKAPFDGRVQKLESVLASAASAYFNRTIFTNPDMYPNLVKKAMKNVPTFDCRCFNVPNDIELANSFLWRENDAIKNSCTGMALNFYSNNEINGRNTDEKIHMMRMKGYCFYEDTYEPFLRGTFYKRCVVEVPINEVDNIPEKFRKENTTVTRTKINALKIPYRLTDIENKAGFLFNDEEPILNKVNPTFKLH